MKDQFVRGGIQRCYGFVAGAEKRAGIDHAYAVDRFIPCHMRVAVQNAVDFQREGTGFETPFVAVENGNSLAVESDLGRNLHGAADSGALEIRLQLALLTVCVAPHKGQRAGEEFIEDRLPAYVTAVNEVLHA